MMRVGDEHEVGCRYWNTGCDGDCDCVTCDDVLRSMVAKHGTGAKLVRAVCVWMGWHHRPGDNGAPREWYHAFRGWLGDALERVLQ